MVIRCDRTNPGPVRLKCDVRGHSSEVIILGALLFIVGIVVGVGSTWTAGAVIGAVGLLVLGFARRRRKLGPRMPSAHTSTATTQ